MMGLTVSPVVLGEVLTAVVLAVALAVAGRRRADLDGRTLGLWLGGALVLEAMAHLVLTWPALPLIPYHFVFASLHALAPVLILMAILSARKATAAASGLPLVLGVLGVIGLGAMIETGVALNWIDATVHGMRALVLAIVALLAWRRLARRLGITVSVLTALMALVSLGATVIAATTAAAQEFGPLAHLLSWVLLVALALSALFAEIRSAMIEASTSAGARSASPDQPVGSLAGPNADGTMAALHPKHSIEAPAVSDMARLCLRMDDLMLAGTSSRGLAALVCQWIAQQDDAALVWVAIRDPFGTVMLQGADGPAAEPLRGLIDQALPGDLADTLVSAARIESSQAGFDIEGAPPGVPMRLGVTGAGRTAEPAAIEGEAAHPSQAPADMWNAALSAANAALVFPFTGAQGRFCALVVHGGALALDRGARQHLCIIARRLASMAQLCHETGFLRLQSAAMSVAANAIFITGDDGRIAWANEAFTRLSGFSGDEVRGKTPHILFSGHQDPKTYADLWSTLKRGDVWRGELVERRKDGSLYTVQQTVTPMRGTDGDAVYYVAVHEDISARKRAEERIRYMSNYDMLTRLPNRVLFRDRLHQAVALARRVKGSVSVLFLDLTQFSRVNDTLGHDIGDQILMTVGSRINAAVVDEVDTVARMGGDEFAIIQSGGNGAEAAASLAVRLARIVETPVEIGGASVSLRATVGIAMYPEDGADPDGLIKAADLAMHRVARTEGEAYRFFSNEINDEAQVRLDLEADLRRALDRGELLNHYQPQYDVKGTLVGLEALVRWQHPTRGLVPPGQFITVAEESGLIVPLGEEVLQRALADLAAWRQDGLPLVPVAVNISAVQLRDSGLVTRLRDALESHDLPPSALDLELTESVLMGEHAGAVGFLTRLADAGFRIAIDDFGTGYSSLSYLKRFPVHKLKIDQSFVRHINEDRNDTILVSAIINLGHSLGMSVIAEGVETEAQFTHLRSVGVDVLQGYLLGRPMPEEQIRPLMTAPALVLPPPDAPAPVTDGHGDGEAP